MSMIIMEMKGAGCMVQETKIRIANKTKIRIANETKIKIGNYITKNVSSYMFYFTLNLNCFVNFFFRFPYIVCFICLYFR